MRPEYLGFVNGSEVVGCIAAHWAIGLPATAMAGSWSVVQVLRAQHFGHAQKYQQSCFDGLRRWGIMF